MTSIQYGLAAFATDQELSNLSNLSLLQMTSNRDWSSEFIDLEYNLTLSNTRRNSSLCLHLNSVCVDVGASPCPSTQILCL